MFGLSQIGQRAIGQIADPSSAPVEATWHYPWSEPVRFNIVPKHKMALIASGPFAPVLEPNTQIIQDFESRWHYPWPEPIRLNLKHPLGTAYQTAWLGPDRLIPAVFVTAVMSAVETNNDTTETNVYVYDNLPTPYEAFADAVVSIKEIVVGAISLDEYVAEDGVTFYVVEEDDETFYVTDSTSGDLIVVASVREIEP